jgi:hypothetical protein
VVVLFAAPLAMTSFAQTFFPNAPGTKVVESATFVSPVAAAFSLPLVLDRAEVEDRAGSVRTYISFVVFYGLLNALLLSTMSWLFNTRWRVAY